MDLLPKIRDYKCRLKLVIESALASGNPRHKERSVGALCYGPSAVPKQQHFDRVDLCLPSQSGCPPTPPVTSFFGTDQRGPPVEEA